MPATFQTKVIIEAFDKAMRTGAVERYENQERKRKESTHCLEERNLALIDNLHCDLLSQLLTFIKTWHISQHRTLVERAISLGYGTYVLEAL